MERLKRVVIKEEFVALTGDYKLAILLNQLIYWSERIKDFDEFIKEENKRMNNNDIDDKPIQLQHGWIYKKAEHLSSETMLGLSKQTIGRLLDKLCECGWIEKRRNPRYKWDKTYQYRVNIIKVAINLKEKGYVLQDYKIDFNNMIPSSKMELQETKTELCSDENGTAIPEIIIKNTKQRLKDNLQLFSKAVWHQEVEPYVNIYTSIREKFRSKPHKRISEPNVSYVNTVIGTLIENDISLEIFQEKTFEYFKQLPQSNDGDIVAFLKASQQRYFELTYDQVN